MTPLTDKLVSDVVNLPCRGASADIRMGHKIARHSAVDLIAERVTPLEASHAELLEAANQYLDEFFSGDPSAWQVSTQKLRDVVSAAEAIAKGATT